MHMAQRNENPETACCLFGILDLCLFPWLALEVLGSTLAALPGCNQAPWDQGPHESASSRTTSGLSLVLNNCSSIATSLMLFLMPNEESPLQLPGPPLPHPFAFSSSIPEGSPIQAPGPAQSTCYTGRCICVCGWNLLGAQRRDNELHTSVRHKEELFNPVRL